MTQEDKGLLLKDLCARLPYGVKVEITHWRNRDKGMIDSKIFHIPLDINKASVLIKPTSDIRPYLFPLSSMTEEQYESLKELGILNNCSHSCEYVNPHIHGVSFVFKGFKTFSLELIEWFHKNHIDYRGLIEKGLAINATGLNIYKNND